MPIPKTISAQAAAELLRQKGHSLRTAAPLLGVHFGHLGMVLQGRRESRRLLSAIQAIPPRTAKPNQSRPICKAAAKPSRR